MARSSAAQPLVSPGPTIVLVEAKPLMRMAVAAYLRECGYQVIETTGPAEARRLLQSGTMADLALIDIDADRESDGFELAQWLRLQRPDIKVLLTSGVQRTAQTAGDLCEQGPHLANPYHPRNLEAQIRRLLAH